MSTPDDTVTGTTPENTPERHYRDIYETGQSVTYNEDGTPAAYHTLLPGPEWYNEHVRGREELLGWTKKNPYVAPKQYRTEFQGSPAYQNWYAPPQLDQETASLMATTIAKHWDDLPTEDPYFSYLLEVNPSLLFADAENAGKSYEVLQQGLDTATRTGGFLAGNFTSPFALEEVEETLRQGENTANFLDSYINFFDADQQNGIAYALAGTDISRRENFASIAHLWWEDQEYDINNPAHRDQFMLFVAERAHQMRNESLEEMGAWNRIVWNPIDATFFGTFQFKDFLRRNLLPNFKRLLNGDETDWTPGNRSWASYFDVTNKYDPQYYQYTGSVPNPDDWGFQTSLTVGQQLAANVTDYGSNSWNGLSGTIDGALYFLTPGDVAINLLTGGFAASKIAVRGTQHVTRVGRAKLVAKSAIPVFGRRAVPTYGGKAPMGVASRIGWALRAQSVDDFVAAAEKAGVYQRMFDLAKKQGMGALVHKVKGMEALVDSDNGRMLESAVNADDYEMFAEIMRLSTVGVLDRTPARTLDELEAAIEEAKKARHDQMDRVAADLKNPHKPTPTVDFEVAAQMDMDSDEIFKSWVYIDDEGRHINDASFPGTSAEFAQVIATKLDEGSATVYLNISGQQSKFDILNNADHEAFLKVELAASPIGVNVDELPDDLKRGGDAFDVELERVAGDTDVSGVDPHIVEQFAESTGTSLELSRLDQYLTGNMSGFLTDNANRYIDNGAIEAIGGWDVGTHGRLILFKMEDGTEKYFFGAPYQQMGNIPADQFDEQAFDTIEDAMAYIGQWVIESRFAQEALVATADINPPVGGIGIRQQLVGFFKGRLKSDEGIDLLADALEFPFQRLPFISAYFATDSKGATVNGGSAFTRYFHAMRDWLRGDDIRNIATDNQQATYYEMVGRIYETVRDLLLENPRWYLDVNTRLNDKSVMDSIVTKVKDNLKPLDDWVKADESRNVDVQDVFNDPEFQTILQEVFETMPDEVFDFWLNQAGFNKTSLDHSFEGNAFTAGYMHSDDVTYGQDYTHFEPYGFHAAKPTGFPGVHILQQSVRHFTDRQIELLFGRMAKRMTKDILEHPPDGVFDENVQQFLAKVLSGDHAAERQFMERVVAEYDHLQNLYKGANHWKYAEGEEVLVPAWRGFTVDDPRRQTSWSYNSGTAEGFSARTTFGYVNMTDMYDAGAEYILKRWLAGRAMTDTVGELIVTKSKVRTAKDAVSVKATAQTETPNWNAIVNLWKSGLAGWGDDADIPPSVRQRIQELIDANYLFDQNGKRTVLGDVENKFGRLLEVEAGGLSYNQLDPALDVKIHQLKDEIAQVKFMENMEAILYDLPPMKPLKVDISDAATAADTRKSFVGQWLKRVGPRVLKAPMPETIDLADPVHAVSEVKRTLKALGASDALSVRIINEFMNAAPQARHDVLEEMFRAVGREQGNPIMEHLIDQALKNTAARRSSNTIDGSGFAVDLGKTENGNLAPSPSYGGTKFLMPDESLYAMIGRYRSSGRLPKVLRRGLTDNTTSQRAKIVEAIRGQVGEKVAAELGDEELLRMAYAMVAPDGRPEWDGMGAVARWRQRYLQKPWAFLHGTFTRSVLALQPIRWMMKVVLLEEPLRAYMFGMPSFVTNPYKMARNLVHQYNVSRYKSLVGNASNLIDDLVARLSVADSIQRQAMLEAWGLSDDISPDAIRGKLAAALRDEITDQFDWVQKTGLAGDIKRATKQQRKLDKIEAANVRRGLKPDFTWDDVDEIVSKSMFSQYITPIESARPMAYTPNDPGLIGSFARAWAREVERVFTDPFMKIAGSLAYGKLDKRTSRTMLMQHKLYPSFRENIINIGRYQLNDAGASEVAAVDAYLKHMGKHVKRMTEPLVVKPTGMAGEMTAHWDEFIAGTIDLDVAGANYIFHLNDETAFADNLASMLQANRGDDAFNRRIPSFIDAPFKETFVTKGAQSDLSAGKKSFYRKFTDFMLSTFGEGATQVFNRRPAYLHKYQETYKMFLDAGLPDELAKKAAHRKAYEAVNYVYFNQDHIPPLIRKMNKVLPFFGAQFEILTTWAYKIPLAQGPSMLGVVRTARKFDRMFAGLVNAGILDVTVDESDNRIGTTSYQALGFDENMVNARYNISFEPGGIRSDTPLGDFVGELGYRFHDGFMKNIVFIRNLLSAEDQDLEDLDFDSYGIAFGNPLDVNPENQGVLAINSLYMTPSPAIKAAITKIARNLDIASTNDMVEAGGQSLEGLALMHGVDRTALLNQNRDILVQELGAQGFADLINGTDDILLPPGAYEIPETSLFDTFIKPWMYPMGFPDSEVNAWTEFIPSTLWYVARGLAIGQGADDPTGFWHTDDEGNVQLDGFLQNLMLPTRQSKYTAAAEVWTGIQDYEARTGSLSRWSELNAQWSELVQEGLHIGDAHLNDDGEPIWDSPTGSVLEVEANEILAEMNILSDEIMRKGMEYAASKQAIRGIMGFFSIVTPKMVHEEQQAIQSYWETRDVEIDPDTGLPNLYHNFTPRGVTDAGTYNDLMLAFLEDPSGKASKQVLRNEWPELWAFAYGKSYWGKAGVPAEIESIDEFFGQIERGERKPFLPHVNMQRVSRAYITAEKETAILESYGDDPWESAGSLLADWYNYKTNISDPAGRAYDELDWYDDYMMDGEYAKYRDLLDDPNDDLTTFQSELRRRVLEFEDLVDQLEEMVPTLYSSPDERAANAKAIASISANLGNLADALGDDFDRFGVQSPRDKIVADYFTQQVGPYYFHLGNLYDSLDDATTEQEQSAIFDRIRDLNDRYGAPVYMQGNRLPSVQDWRWAGKSPEEQQLQIEEWITNPVEWLDATAIARLREERPELRQYLPDNTGGYQAFKEYARARDEINERASFNPETGEPYATESERRVAMDNLELQLRTYLYNNGMVELINYMDMWPIERMAVSGDIPASVEPLAGWAYGLRLSLDAADMTTGQQEVVRNTIDPAYAEHYQRMQSDPEYAEFFRDIGLELYDGQIDARSVFNAFVLGRWYDA